ncbi:MAG: GH32 C-terminal domain-containing protein [Collinsella sp.]
MLQLAAVVPCAGAVDEVRNVRIVGDVSSVEVFVNDGALVFSTRIIRGLA